MDAFWWSHACRSVGQSDTALQETKWLRKRDRLALTQSPSCSPGPRSYTQTRWGNVTWLLLKLNIRPAEVSSINTNSFWWEVSGNVELERRFMTCGRIWNGTFSQTRAAGAVCVAKAVRLTHICLNKVFRYMLIWHIMAILGFTRTRTIIILLNI